MMYLFTIELGDCIAMQSSIVCTPVTLMTNLALISPSKCTMQSPMLCYSKQHTFNFHCILACDVDIILQRPTKSNLDNHAQIFGSRLHNKQSSAKYDILQKCTVNIPILPEAFLLLQAKVDGPSFSGNVSEFPTFLGLNENEKKKKNMVKP